MVEKPEFGPGKRRVDVTDAYIQIQSKFDVLVCRPQNYYLDWLNGSLVTTGPILAKRGNLVETRQNVYNVLSWDENKTPRQLELF
jgi:hypothetical protein